MIVVKITSEITDKKLACQPNTTAKELAKQFAEKSNLDTKGKKLFIQNMDSKKVMGDNELIANVPRANEITWRFYMEDAPSSEMTEEELELARSMENLRFTRQSRLGDEHTEKNEFSLALPSTLSLSGDLGFDFFDVDLSQKKGTEQKAQGTGKNSYLKENTVQATSVFQDLDFGFGDYDAKTMIKFEFESVVDGKPLEVIHQFDPKKVTYLDIVGEGLRTCETCGQQIDRKDLTSSFGKLYHKRCLACHTCKKDFSVLLPKDGKDNNVYCEDHWYDMFAEKCCKCNFNIKETPVDAIGKKWHSHCFTCTTCSDVLDPKSYGQLKGLPYCEQHFYDERGLVCPICELPIKTEDFVDPKRGAKFHTEHFFCAYCRKKLTADQLYKEVDRKPNKIYCAPCCLRIFGF